MIQEGGGDETHLCEVVASLMVTLSSGAQFIKEWDFYLSASWSFGG